MANSISSSTSNPIPNSLTTINDLPQLILIHILTFLPIPEAIQTSLISRTFRNLWHFLPSLNFDIEDFYSRSTSPHPRCDNSRKLFAEFVSQTLNFRQLNALTKFQLTFEYTNFNEHKFDVQSWVRYAVNLSVSEIVLDFRCEDKFSNWKDPDDDSDDEADKGDRLYEYDFFLSDIVKSDIKVLKLYKCYLMLPLITNPFRFVSLKSLTIADALLTQGNHMCNLVGLCVNLEILTLARVAVATKVGLVVHSSTLKELNLYVCSHYEDERLDLDICCPSLQKISLVCSELGKVVNKDTTQLMKACIDFTPLVAEESYKESWEKMLSYFTNISSLQAWHTLLGSNEVPAGCEQFASNVKHLELYCCFNENDLVGLAALLKLLPKLEILALNNRGRIDENLGSDYRKGSTVFNMPLLKKLIIRNYHKTKRERYFINLFRKNGVVLDKIELIRPSNQIEYYKY